MKEEQIDKFIELLDRGITALETYVSRTDPKNISNIVEMMKERFE